MYSVVELTFYHLHVFSTAEVLVVKVVSFSRKVKMGTRFCNLRGKAGEKEVGT